MPLLLLLSHSVVSSFATPWTVAHQAPLSMGFPRQEYWSELPFPSPGDLPHPGIKLRSPSLASRFFTTTPPGKPFNFLPLIKFSLSANCTPTLQPTQTCIHTHTYTHTHTAVWTIRKNVLVAIKLWFLTWFSAAGPKVCVSKCEHSGHLHQSLVP